MPTELERRASEAWTLMTRQPNILDTITGCEAMPVAVALDYVQNVTGDRDDAVTALITAGADWLDKQTQPGGFGEVGSGCTGDAELIRGYIRGEIFGLALVHLVHIRDRCYLTRTFPGSLAKGQHWLAQEWDWWADKALHAIDHCRAVVAAAYPEDAEAR